MNYVVTVLPNRMQAEAAYSALIQENLLNSQIDILGSGYQNADDYILIGRNQDAKQGVKRLLYWLVPFGFVAGFAFDFFTNIEIFPTVNTVGNYIISGIFGAISSILGVYFLGDIALTKDSKHTLPYRHLLNEGKYLIVVKGTEEITHQASEILRQFEPENIQSYTEPTGK